MITNHIVRSYPLIENDLWRRLMGPHHVGQHPRPLVRLRGIQRPPLHAERRVTGRRKELNHLKHLLAFAVPVANGGSSVTNLSYVSA